MTVVNMQDHKRMRMRFPEGLSQWDTDTAVMVLVVGALAYLVLVRIGFADVVAP